MKRIIITFIGIIFLTGFLGAGCSKDDTDDGSFTCEVDVVEAYEAASELDETMISDVQELTANIPGDIEIRITEHPVSSFGGTNALLNVEERWVQAHYAFLEEDTSDSLCAPDNIRAVVVTKMKTMEHVADAFELVETTQGLCSDAQQVVYDTVLNDILNEAQREKYLAEGKTLSFIPDNSATNPVKQGPNWLPVDPAEKFIGEGNDYTYEPWSLFLESDDPIAANGPEGLRGVRYCKLLTHEGIAHWMLEESFNESPVFITPTPFVCNQPFSTESPGGSCIFYFLYVDAFYCADFTGIDYVAAGTVEAKCDENGEKYGGVAIYNESPCKDRTEEISGIVPDYTEYLGTCVVGCQETGEFLWNVYGGDLMANCGGGMYPVFTAEEMANFTE